MSLLSVEAQAAKSAKAAKADRILAEEAREAADGAQTITEYARDETVSARDEALNYGSARLFRSWSEASAATFTADEYVMVISTDTGTHTDPVVGGIVSNAGVFRYSGSPAGLERVGDLQGAIAQKWADGPGEPGGPGTKSAKGWAEDASDMAAAAQAGVGRFRETIAQGVADFAVDEFFASAETGATRIYRRTATAPFYVDVGDGAAPFTIGGADARYAQSSALAATGGAGAIGFIQTGSSPVARDMLAKARELYSVQDRGAIGDGAADDTAKIGGAGRILRVPRGTYAASDAQVVAGGGFIGEGHGSVIQQNDLNAAFVLGRNDAVQAEWIWIENFVIDGNKDLGTFTGEGHGLDLRGVKYVYIDKVIVKNCHGHGVRFRNCDTVVIGTLTTIDCDKFGTVVESNTAGVAATNIFFDTIISINCGHDTGGDGWTGIDFGDCPDDASGPQKIFGNKLISIGAGRVGVALGRNANGVTGPRQIQIGMIYAVASGQVNAVEGNGVELFAARGVQIGQIITTGNTAHGVWINKGDDLVTLCERGQIGQIISQYNGRHGVYGNGFLRYQIGSILSRNNGQNFLTDGSNWSGVSFYGSNSAAMNGWLQATSIQAWDDQATKTQAYGLEIQSGAHFGQYQFGQLQVSGNRLADFNNASPVLIDVGRINDDAVIWPTYTTASAENSLLRIGGEFVACAQTVNSAVTKAIFLYGIPENSVVHVTARVTAFENLPNDNAAERCYFAKYAFIRRVGSGGAALEQNGDLQTPLRSNTNISCALNVYGGSDPRIVLNVTGLSAKTLFWKAWIEVKVMKL